MNNLKSFFLTIFLIIFALYLIKIFDISYPLTIVSTSRTNELSVVGEAKMEITPDTAYVNLGITTKEKTVKEVQDKINQVNNSLINELRNLGIKKEAIKTTNYSVYPDYDYTFGQKIIGYSGNASLQVKLKNFDLINKTLEIAEKVGVNQINGVNFVVEKPEIYREKVREKAIENAKNQAQKLAKTLGIRLGKITNIVEAHPQEPVPYFKSASLGMGGGGDSAVIEPGVETISTVVTLYFEKR